MRAFFAFKAKLILIAFVVATSSSAWADTCTTNFKALYRAGLQKKNPVQFGYEIEITLKDNPKIVDFYRLADKTEDEWKALPLDTRIRLTERKYEIEKAKGLDRPVLVRMSNMPDHFAKTVRTEANGRLELSDNLPTSSLADLEQQLQWFEKTIGPGSLQGHATFKNTAELLDGAIPYIKHDSEISVLESLERSGRAAETNPESLDLTILNHPSLGVLGDQTLSRVEKQMVDTGRFSPKVDPETKLVYGVAYRPDLYGFNRTGFEVRNCNIRIDCVTSKLAEIASNLETGFKKYDALVTNDVRLSRKTVAEWPLASRDFLDDVAKAVRSKNPHNKVGGASIEERYSLPLVAWEQHPMVLALEPKVRAAAKKAILDARKNYLEGVQALAAKSMPMENKIRELNGLAARWSKSSELTNSLKAGKKSLFGDSSEPDFADALLTKMGVVDTGDRSDVFENLILNLRKIGLDQNKLLEMKQELGAHELTYLVGSASTVRNAAVAKVLSENKVLAQVFYRDDAPYFVQQIAEVSDEGARRLLSIAERTGLKSDKVHPDGGRFYKNIMYTSPEALNALARAATRTGREEELEKLFTTPFVYGIPTQLTSAQGAEALLKLVSDSVVDRSDAATYFLKEFAGKGAIQAQTKDDLMTYQALIGLMSRDVKPVDKKTTLVRIGDESYRLSSVVGSQQFKLDKVSGVQLKSIEAQSKKLLDRLGRKKETAFSDSALMTTVLSSPDTVSIIAGRNYTHQGIVIGDSVFEISTSRGVSKTTVASWISEDGIGDSTVVQLAATPQRVRALRSSLLEQVGKAQCFSVLARSGSVNCTNMVSDALSDAKIITFPDSRSRSSSVGQIDYLRKNAQNLPEVVQVIKRAAPIKIMTKANAKALGVALIPGVTINAVIQGVPRVYHQVWLNRELDPYSSRFDGVVRDVAEQDDSIMAYSKVVERHCGDSKLFHSSAYLCLAKAYGATTNRDFKLKLETEIAFEKKELLKHPRPARSPSLRPSPSP